MAHEQFDWSKISIDEVFEARRQAKEEQGRRLAELPFEKKIEIVEKFKRDSERRLNRG